MAIVRRWCGCLGLVVLLLLSLTGCATGPTWIPPEQRSPIDRSVVEYPAGYRMELIGRNMTAPSAIAFDEKRNLLIIAESGNGGFRPRIYGFNLEDNSYINIYPKGRVFALFSRNNVIRAPIGGLAVQGNEIFVSHRDDRGMGRISAIDLEGNIRTVVADLPAAGDHSVTDIAIHPTTGRLYFGLGTATNSGVVGTDNFATGWVRRHPDFADRPAVDLKLLGYRFDARNPDAGVFSGNEIAVTSPFQPFGTSNRLRIPAASDGKPTGAIYSVSPSGGDLRVEAHGLRLPRGLAFSEFGNLFVTNNGMELRGTRPVKDDPDTLMRVVPNTWYGWPDFSADLQPISEARFQPPVEMVARSGYPEVSPVIDHEASGLTSPTPYRDTLLFAIFPSLSGAAKMDFARSTGAFREFRGNAIVALSGDRSPFASGGLRLIGPIGFHVVRVDIDTKQVRPFIHNTRRMPASRFRGPIEALERPVDVLFVPDGSMYLLDYGAMEMRGGQERIRARTGKLYRLTREEADGR